MIHLGVRTSVQKFTNSNQTNCWYIGAPEWWTDQLTLSLVCWKAALLKQESVLFLPSDSCQQMKSEKRGISGAKSRGLLLWSSGQHNAVLLDGPSQAACQFSQVGGRVWKRKEWLIKEYFAVFIVSISDHLAPMYERKLNPVNIVKSFKSTSLYSSPQGPRFRWQGTCCPTPQNVQWQSPGPQKPSSSVSNRSVWLCWRWSMTRFINAVWFLVIMGLRKPAVNTGWQGCSLFLG